ncbi:mannitol dehydrogenase family protein [Bordetella petrii]|uniref:mannitol dehydrogenase family protein n=1 Tax=Bordetella petrii TaxID=94624 RepID=UPI0038B4018F
MAGRLNAASLAGLPADVARPAYDRRRLRAGIVHLGMGAFHRAHQAPVTDLALAASGDRRWGIVGVSLRSPATRDALAPQDGLYTLSLRDVDAAGRPREALAVIGAVRRVLVAAEDPAAVLAQIAHPDTRIVSLTVTEKGYCHEPATGRLRGDDPDIIHDLVRPDAPRSAIGMLVHGLRVRHAAGRGPVTLLSCDNLPANGDTLRGLVLEFAAAVAPRLRDWIARHCTFPNSMVDRIVPRSSDDDRRRIAARLGVADAWPVVGEPFLEWIIEDRFAAGRPAWDQPGGARFVADAAPFERLKLRMVNGPHSALAYLGVSAGFATVSEAVAEPALRGYLDALMRDEIAPTLPATPGLAPDALRARLLARFANPALPHRLQQIAMDGSQKLPQRLLDTLRDRLRAGAGFERLALAVAAWLQYLGGHDERGASYQIEDPLAAELRARVAAAGEGAAADAARARALVSYAPVFGDLAGHAAFVDAVARHASIMRRHGARAAAREAL